LSHVYKKENPEGYQLTQFYKLYGDFLSENYGLDKVKMPVGITPAGVRKEKPSWSGTRYALNAGRKAS